MTEYMRRAVYEAAAIADGDEPDEFGLFPVYTLRYELPENAAEGYEPDWDCPDDIEPCGGVGNQASYCPESDRIF